jgi:hypothetical protein
MYVPSDSPAFLQKFSKSGKMVSTLVNTLFAKASLPAFASEASLRLGGVYCDE